nr:hypothetical protein [Desulfobacterales bacterium]
MLEICSQIRYVAANDYPVHVGGETRPGKELVAMAIHKESHRGAVHGSYDCDALAEEVYWKASSSALLRGPFQAQFATTRPISTCPRRHPILGESERGDQTGRGKARTCATGRQD